jgi:hypothetical protein
MTAEDQMKDLRNLEFKNISIAAAPLEKQRDASTGRSYLPHSDFPLPISALCLLSSDPLFSVI